MVNQAIQIYARLKPKKNKFSCYEIGENAVGENIITFTFPKDSADGYVNNKKEQYRFQFKHVFDQNAKQDAIFETVAHPVIDNVLSGYNGTIFAYGQTGSGKTYTITGGAERYEDRGIIPRTLSYIFSSYKKNAEMTYTTHVSYLEIYNENGYDLLDPNHEAAKLEDLPKVTMLEDSDQNIHMKNLSTHQVSTEEDSLNLLFLGDTNRMIAETPMNQASTRSHCIFTIHITSRVSGSATIRRSKLHLVDLAGSERVSKTGVNGILLTEAKYINLSLHYLEQVIVALSEKSRQHIPYRNSMMTSVLRDSLGGNCMTSMIATCSVDKPNVDETVSTCRFAQRVALIKNDISLNEELDPQLLIGRLKGEIVQLKEQLQLATGEQPKDALTEEELKSLHELVKTYLEDKDPESKLNVGSDLRKIHAVFRIMKKEFLQLLVSRSIASNSARESHQSSSRDNELANNPLYNKELHKLKELLVQRDNEINILVGMLKKEKKKVADLGLNGNSQDAIIKSQQGGLVANGRGNLQLSRDSVREEKGKVWSMEKSYAQEEKEEQTKTKILGEMSIGRQEAFEIFRRDYEHNQTIEDNKTILKQRYAEAKSLGENVNQCRTSINKLKSHIEQHRLTLAMQGRIDSETTEPDEVELELRQTMENEKTKYKENYNRLKALKTEIEHLQHLLEKSKLKLLKDFEVWWNDQTAQAAAKAENAHARPVQQVTAWSTPPVTPPMQQVQRLLDPGQKRSLAPLDTRRKHNLAETSNNMHDPANLVRNSNGSFTGPMHVSTGTESLSFNSSSSSFKSNSNRANNMSSHSSSVHTTGGITLTGDPQADADILAFVNARQNILKQTQQFGFG